MALEGCFPAILALDKCPQLADTFAESCFDFAPGELAERVIRSRDRSNDSLCDCSDATDDCNELAHTYREFIRAFQVMDRVIQDRQPLFMVVWVGSVIAILLALGLGFQQQDGLTRALLVAATALYLLGVQLPTARVNIPLNNEIQTVEVEAIGAVEQKQARERFEPRWNRWNQIRTAMAFLTMLLLLIVLVRLPGR